MLTNVENLLGLLFFGLVAAGWISAEIGFRRARAKLEELKLRKYKLEDNLERLQLEYNSAHAKLVRLEAEIEDARIATDRYEGMYKNYVTLRKQYDTISSTMDWIINKVGSRENARNTVAVDVSKYIELNVKGFKRAEELKVRPLKRSAAQ